MKTANFPFPFLALVGEVIVVFLSTWQQRNVFVMFVIFGWVTLVIELGIVQSRRAKSSLWDSEYHKDGGRKQTISQHQFCLTAVDGHKQKHKSSFTLLEFLKANDGCSGSSIDKWLVAVNKILKFCSCKPVCRKNKCIFHLKVLR